MKRLLVIEDGEEYARFAGGLLAESFVIEVARNAAQALERAAGVDRFLVDLRFDRATPAELVGDLAEIERTLFGGDRTRALRHQQDEQGVYILRALREAGHSQRAVFVHDFTSRRLGHLRQRYGDVDAVAGFDAQALCACLEGP